MNGWVKAAVGLQLLLASAAPATAKPQRIVSLNLCVDLLLLQLADREHIASLTHLATDPELSALAEMAADIPQNHGLAEEILGYDPDLVIGGAFTTLPTVALLEQLGRRVLTLPAAESFAGVRALVMQVATAIDEVERGRLLIANMDARLAAISPPVGQPARAVVYEPHGYTAGRHTLVDEVIRAAGMANIAIELGVVGHQPVPLEIIVLAEPDRLIISSYRPDQASLARTLLQHPSLKSRLAARSVVLPTKLWVCGNPIVVEAVERLASSRGG